MSCSKTQYLVHAGIKLPLSGLIQQTTKKEKKNRYLFYYLTFHAMERICMKCKSCFLGSMRKIFQNVVCWNFTQNVKRYGLHKQIAHGSVHGKTYNNLYEEANQPAHSEPAHQSDLSLRQSYVPPTIYGFNKTSCAMSEDSIFATAHSDQSIRWSHLPLIAGLSKAG